MDRKDELRKKLKAKINEKRLQEGRRPNQSKNFSSNQNILETTKMMIQDCNRPMIKRLNIRQKYNILSKKYQLLKDRHIPIFRSVLNGELTMENIDMLEMMLNMKDSASYDQMNNFLAEKYKLDGDEPSKNDKINLEKANKEFKDYLDKNPEENPEEKD